MKEYALYKGDEFIAIGTRKELANILGVSVNTVSFYMTPTHINRTKGDDGVIVIRIEDEN